MTTMNFKTLAALMPLQAMRDQAWAQTCDLTERHDVPNDDSVPEDLRDRIGFYWKTASGYRIAGRLLPSDLLQGSPSAAIPVFLTVGVFLVLLSVLVAGLGGKVQVIAQLISLVYLVLVLQVVGLGFFLLTLLGLAATAIGSFLPIPMVGAIGPNVGMLLIAVLPWLYTRILSRERAHKLALNGTSNAHEDGGELRSSHSEARVIQAENAASDTTPFIKLGTARGTFHSLMDGYAPDPGLPFGLSCKDLSTHLVVFGATGTGKTSGVLRPVAQTYLESGYGGALILDGKGQLAAEFSNYKDYLLVEPGMCQLGLMEGLEPEDVVQAISSINSGPADGDNQFFVSSGRQMLLAAAVILREVNKVSPATYPWTFQLLNEFLDTMVNPERAREYIDYLKDRPQNQGLLSDAIQYYKTKVPQMDERTRGNILSTCAAWLAPLMSHPKTLPWTAVEKGVDVTCCLRGGIVGVNVPANEYGDAGAIITALVKTRIFTAVRRRKADWQRNGVDKPMLMLVDEAQAVIGKAELDIFPVARSLGLMGVYATQSVDEFYGRFGEHQALALLNNFRSFVTFSSSASTIEWVMNRTGHTSTRMKTYKTGRADAGFAAQLAAGSPVFDTDHPDRKHMRAFARDHVGGVWSVAKQGLSQLGGMRIDLDYTTGYEEVQQPLLTHERADAYLAAPQHAVMQVMRAGVRRRDIVRTEPRF